MLACMAALSMGVARAFDLSDDAERDDVVADVRFEERDRIVVREIDHHSALRAGTVLRAGAVLRPGAARRAGAARRETSLLRVPAVQRPRVVLRTRTWLRAARRLVVKLRDEVAARGPPRLALGIIGIRLGARRPDPALRGLCFGLGGDEVAIEATRTAVLRKVRAHARAYGLDVVVDPLAVLLGEHVREVAPVAILDLVRIVALEPHGRDVLEPGLGPALRLVAKRRRELRRPRRCPAHVLRVRGEAFHVRAALLVVLERFLGIDPEQSQRAIEPLHAHRIAIADPHERELADDEVAGWAPRDRRERWAGLAEREPAECEPHEHDARRGRFHARPTSMTIGATTFTYLQYASPMTVPVAALPSHEDVLVL